ncbi:hypothetical protein [Burkholderia stagnalis]
MTLLASRHALPAHQNNLAPHEADESCFAVLHKLAQKNHRFKYPFHKGALLRCKK